MYEAVRQRAPRSSQLAGVFATALALAAAIYVFMSGFGAQIMKVIPIIIYDIEPPKTPDQPPPTDTIQLDTTVDLPLPKPPDWTPIDFKYDDDSNIKVDTGPAKSVGTGAVIGGPAGGPAVTRPKMIAGEKPPYPGSEIRAHNEGITSLQLCIGANGRVTSASLAQTSGHERLDEAALKWVRGVRFTPGTVGGAPAAVCGHSVSYEWKIEAKCADSATHELKPCPSKAG